MTIALLAFNTGKYQLSVAEGLVLRQTDLPSWKGTLPQVVSQFPCKPPSSRSSCRRQDDMCEPAQLKLKGQEILDSFAANKSNHHFKVVGYTSGRCGSRMDCHRHLSGTHALIRFVTHQVAKEGKTLSITSTTATTASRGYPLGPIRA